ncbi:Ldb16 [Kluyveromyces lactis]|nr:Ldb16 [Kluyveromyces lactis]
MSLLALAKTSLGFITRILATLYLYTLQLMMSTVYMSVRTVHKVVIHPVKRIIHYVVVIPSEIILRNLAALVLLPINIPLYILFGSSVKSLYHSFDANATTFGVVMLSQYVLSMLILGFTLGIMTGVFLSCFHKFVPIPNIYWEPSIGGFIGSIKGLLFSGPTESSREHPYRVPIPRFSTKRQSNMPGSSSYTDAKVDTAASAAVSSILETASDLGLDLRPHHQPDIGNMTPLSLPDTNEDSDQELGSDEDLSEMSRFWGNDQGYGIDTIRTEMTDDINHLIYRNRNKKDAENVVDIRNL